MVADVSRMISEMTSAGCYAAHVACEREACGHVRCMGACNF